MEIFFISTDTSRHQFEFSYETVTKENISAFHGQCESLHQLSIPRGYNCRETSEI